MAKHFPIDIIGSFNELEGVVLNPERTVNMYEVVSQSGDGSLIKGLYPTPGLALYREFDLTGAVRLLFPTQSDMYAVIANSVYRIDKTNNAVFLGNVSSREKVIPFTNNLNHLVFVEGGKGYTVDLKTGLLEEITSVGFPTLPTFVTALGDRIIVNYGETNKWGISNAGDARSWDASQVAFLTSVPDYIVGGATVGGRLFLMGSISTEGWYDAGRSPFPFLRDNSLLLPYGCKSEGSIATGEGRLVWLTNDKQGVGGIVVTSGGLPVFISTKPLERVFKDYAAPEDCSAYIYKEEGHIFYLINFTTDNHSWLFNFTTKKWCEIENLPDNRYSGDVHCFFNGRHYVGDFASPKIYEMSSKFYDYDGVSIRRMRITKLFSLPNHKEFCIGKLEVVLEQGTGSSYGVDEDPRLFLSLSRNKGLYFGSKITAPIGKIGKWQTKTQFTRLGYQRDVVFKFEYFNSRRITILGANVEIV